MEQHVTYLDHVCRVGGKKFSSLNQTVRYEASSYACQLLSAFGIDISSDKPEVHPKYVCILCQRILLRAHKESAAHCGGGCGEVQEWTQHTRLKVAREGRDKIFTFSFWCIFGANNFFSSKFSGKGVGAMPYLLTNFWSRDSVYDGFLNI